VSFCLRGVPLTTTDRASPSAGLVHVLINARAGAASDQEATIAAVEGALRDADVRAEVVLASGEDLVQAAERAVTRARRGEIGAVVVGGGDGSVSAAASALADTAVPLGILPLGTLNHFARDAGIPLGLAEAVAVIKAANVRRVDVGDVNGRTFVNNSSIGVYPKMVLDRDSLRKRRRLAKWPAMVLAVLHALRSLSHRRLRVRAGGGDKIVRTPLIFVGNNQYSRNPFALGRRERLDRGELWLYVVRPVGLTGVFRLAARLALALPRVEDDLIVSKVATATIDAKAGRLLVALDGEVTALETPLRYSIRPKALALLAP